jgi:hypothetical protein
MARQIKPERLDSLDPMDPKAIASRKDLVTINQLMGNYRWFERALKPIHGARLHALEIGAGGGELGSYLDSVTKFATYTAVDFAPRPEKWPEHAMWHRGDILHYDNLGTTELLIANLILHHFTDEQLDQLGKRLKRSSIRHILANEPCRRPIHKWQLWAGCAIGFNAVTLYDGSVSIDAGFKENELAHKLGLKRSEWLITVNTTMMGAYRMEAHRR